MNSLPEHTKYRRFAVLGSNSFAGAAFVTRALQGNVEVIGFNRSAEGSPAFLPYKQSLNKDKYRFHRADINCDLPKILEYINAFRPEVIVDFVGQGMVAESWQDPAQWYTTNIVAKVRLHDQLRRFDWLQRYIRISTLEVYGSQDTLLKESWVYNPSTPYAVSHAAIDMSLRVFYQSHGFPVIFTRFANFYGPGQQLYRIVPRTIIYVMAGRKLQLHGGGTSIRAFIYSADVADGIMRAIVGGKPGEVYHFSTDRFPSIRQVVELICQRMGVAFESIAEIAPERPGKDKAYLMDSSRSRSELGWGESVTLEQGIDATIKWVKENFEEIKTLPWNYIHKQ